MADPKGFLKFKRETPERTPVEERTRHFKEFYRPMPEEALKRQGGRCMDCGIPFCQSSYGCPVENLIPEWNDMVHRGRWYEALKILHQTNNFPEFTGKLCPAPCETACVLGTIDSPVSIRTLESSIIDRGFQEGWVEPLLPVEKTGKQVAIIGSGPAGLAAAQQLARAGHQVTVYEKSDRIGGLLRYGIPDFKMEKWVLDRRLDQLRAEGVEFVTGVAVGRDLEVAALLERYHAVCLATGAEQPRDLPIPGRDLKGVHFAMDYLTQQNRLNAGDPLAGERINAQGKRVVIIGGGDTGSDCLGTARRQGCIEAYQFELLPRPPESRAESTPWPQWPLQLRTSHAHEEGCERRWSYLTTEFVGENGHVKAVRGHRVELVDGKFVPSPESAFEIEAELVLIAMGFSGPVKNGLLEALGVQLTSRGTVAVDAGYKTTVPKVFAAGDVKRGASLVVWAISEGRKMADAVNRFLSNA